MSFAENLRKYREKAGYTAKEFAALLDVKYSTYAAYENQGSEPKYETLCKIADALNITTDELLGHTPKSKYEKMCKYLADMGFDLVEDDRGITVIYTNSHNPLCTYTTKDELRKAMINAYYEYYDVTERMRRYVFGWQFLCDDDSDGIAQGYYLNNVNESPDLSNDIDGMAEIIEGVITDNVKTKWHEG